MTTRQFVKVKMKLTGKDPITGQPIPDFPIWQNCKVIDKNANPPIAEVEIPGEWVDANGNIDNKTIQTYYDFSQRELNFLEQAKKVPKAEIDRLRALKTRDYKTFQVK